MESIKHAIDKSKLQTDIQANNKFNPARRDSQSQTEGSLLGAPKCHLNRAHLENTRIVAFDGENVAARAYDMLRTRIMQKMRFSNHHVLGITSPRAECGKTVTAINLAFSMARQPNQVVLLADLDLRKPSIAKCLGIKSQSDVHDVLSGDARLHNSCVGLNIGGSGLRVLPCSGTVVDPSLLFNSGNMEELLSGLRDKAGQGIVIVDLPPVLVADDVIAVLPHIDNVLLVAASGQTTPAEIEECERLLSGADSLDIILNKAKVSAKSYY